MRSSLRLLILTALLNTQFAVAENKEAPWYQVELFIFGQNHNNLMTEHWDETIYPLPHPAAVEIYGESGKRMGITPLKAANRKTPIAKSLMSRNGYRPLYHQVWKQPIQTKRNARPIRIRGGEALNDTTYELEGDISIDIARYLHLRTNLYYSLRKPTNWQSSLASDLPLESPSASDAIISLTESTENSSDSEDLNTEANATPHDPSLLTMKMEQGRRMRGGQIHYLDHPMFGLFIQMTRIEAPNAANEPTSKPQAEETALLSEQSDNSIANNPSAAPPARTTTSNSQ